MFNNMRESMAKAFGALAQQGANARQRNPDRYRYEPYAIAIHADGYLKGPDKRALLEVTNAIAMSRTQEERREHISKLVKHRVRRVNVKTEIERVRGKYDGRTLRRINAAGGGPKERARAAKRAAAMAAAAAPAALAA